MKSNSHTYLWPFDLPKSICILLLGVLILRLFLTWQWPMLNDESYYWDWARNLQLSYVDAPPAVAWVAWVGSHLFSGSFGARFLVPFLYMFTAIFLIKSAGILSRATQNSPLFINIAPHNDTFIALRVIVTFYCVFSFQGIMLLPDAPLFFACSGALYYALKSCEAHVLSYENALFKTHPALSLKHALFLGFFIGLAIVSKYQGVPLSLGLFFAIVFLRGFKTTLQKDILFWITTILMAFIIASPLFIWNFQNNFASFKFQGQHGFSSWSLNLNDFFIYIISIIGIVLPWSFYLFVKQTLFSFKNKKILRSLDFIPIFAFLAIFLFIMSGALGKHSELHWITPSFLFLIPLTAANWHELTKKHAKFWKIITIISVLIITVVSTTIFTKPIQTFLAQDKTILGLNMKNIHNGLYNGLIWGNLHDPEQSIAKHVPQIQQAEKFYFKNLNEVQCKKEPYFATFNWRWAGQFAFYLKNNPRVFSLNLSRSTYYTWRDSLPYLANCRIFVVGPQSMYNEKQLQEIMTIQSVQKFTIQKSYTYDNLDMIFIDGVMKDKQTLETIDNDLLKTGRF